MKLSEQPFDAVAADYDARFTLTETGRMQRARVYDYLEDLLDQEKPAKVLELNCGTGEDALFLAHKGMTVLATDSSPQMVAVTAEKVKKAGIGEKVKSHVCRIEQVGSLQPEGPFDWVFSNFGGLNCIPPEQLPLLRDNLKGLLPSGGHFLAVVMPRFCLWESLYFLGKLKPGQAFRRLRSGPVWADLGGSSLPIWYFGPGFFARQFAPDFEVVGLRPVGLALPPSYLEPFFRRRPKLLAWLQRREAQWGKAAWAAGLSDHFLLHLQKR